MDDYERFKKHNNHTWGTAIVLMALGFLLGFLACHKIYTGMEGLNLKQDIAK